MNIGPVPKPADHRQNTAQLGIHSGRDSGASFTASLATWFIHVIVGILFLSPPARAAESAGTSEQQQLKPYTHQVDTTLTLSAGVSIDDPDRIVHWMGDKPEVIERAKDPVKWAGDPKYWSDGEFVENPIPGEYPPGTPGVNVRCSKHIRIVYGNHPTMTEEYVHGNLRLFTTGILVI